MIHSFRTFKHAVVVCVMLLVGTAASAQTFMVFSAEKALSLYVGTSMNFDHKFSTDNYGTKNYTFDHQSVKPGLALNFAYAWFTEIGDWLYGSYNFTFGIQQDRLSATFINNSTALAETYDISRTLLGFTGAYRLGFDIVEHWQAYLGLGAFLRFPVKGEPESHGINLGLFPELSVYYHINRSLCCSFLARYDVLAFGGALASNNLATLTSGAYLKSAGKSLTCMIGIGYTY